VENDACFQKLGLHVLGL